MREFRLQANDCLDFEDFTSLMKSLINAVMPEVTFVEAFPSGPDHEEVNSPIITYKVYKRVPTEIKSRYRESPFEHSDPTKTVSILGQKFEYTIQFDIWAENNEQANRIMNDLENMINTYKGDIKQAGVQEFLFAEQGLDNDVSSVANVRAFLAHRVLWYKVMLERLTIDVKPKLQLIKIRDAKTGALLFQIPEY